MDSEGAASTQDGLPLAPPALAKAIISLVDGRKRFPSEAQPQAAALLARLSPFFAEQPPRFQLDMCALLRLERCYSGQVLQRQGGRGRCFYILLKGLVEETVAAADRSRTDLVRALRPGDSFGAEAIRKRKYTCPTAIQCQTPCYFLKLDKPAFLKVFESRALGERGRVAQFFSTVPCLGDCSPAQLAEVAATAVPTRHKAGAPFVLEAMEGIGIVRRGQLSLYAEVPPMDARASGARGAAARRATWLSTLGPAAVLGVASLSPELRRDWYAEAASTVDLLCLQKEDLKRILGPEKLRALRDEFRFMVDYLEGRHRDFPTDEPALVIEEPCSQDELILTKTRSFATVTKGEQWAERTRNSLPSQEAAYEGTAKRPATAGPLRRTAMLPDGTRSRRPQSAAAGPRSGSTERFPEQWSGSQFSAQVIFTPELCDPVDRSNAALSEQRKKAGGARATRLKPPGSRVEKTELGLAWQLVLRERQRSMRLNPPT